MVICGVTKPARRDPRVRWASGLRPVAATVGFAVPAVASLGIAVLRPNDRAWYAFMLIAVIVAILLFTARVAAAVAGASIIVVLVLTFTLPAVSLSLSQRSIPMLALHTIVSLLLVLVAFRHDSRERRWQQSPSADTIRERHELHAKAFGPVAGSIAHDLNNLLMFITHQASVLETEAADAERNRLADIRCAGDKAAALSRRLLELALGQGGPSRTVAIDQLIREMEPLLANVLGNSIGLDLQFAPGLLRVEVDSIDIERVLMNLIVNAHDAMPDGGAVTIRVRNVVLDEAYVDSHPGARRGTHVLLEIGDTGAGMDEATRVRAFDARFTTKSEAGGTGLGLSTVRSIVEKAGGHVVLWSEPGRGTVFRIYLPA